MMTIDGKTNIIKWVAIAIAIIATILKLFGIDFPIELQNLVQEWSTNIIMIIIAIISHFVGKADAKTKN